MSLLYKPDWEETKKRYMAWWAHEALDRCALAVTAPGKDAPREPPPEPPIEPPALWTDLDYIAKCNEYTFRRRYYGGEALPIWNGGYPGHTAIPAFLGCPTTLDLNTGWWDPILTGEELDVRSLRVDKTGKWWRFAVELLKRGVRESRGKSLVTIGAFGGCGDTLAGLRGTERLLYDVIDRPDQVAAAESYLMQMWMEVYDEFYAVIREADQGSTCWFPLWSPGKFYGVSNDFSYSISPDFFRRMFLPVIDKQTRFLDHAVYHTDGEGAFAHVPALCELPRLQAIQILPGDGKPSALHYMETLKTVQRAGKNLWLSLSKDEVEPALRTLSARGLMIDTACASEAEARQLLANARKWSRD